MRRAILAMTAGGLLLAAAPAHKVKIAPADDKEQPFGAAARKKHGPDPMAVPPADAGSAEDPPAIANGQPPAPPKASTPR